MNCYISLNLYDSLIPQCTVLLAHARPTTFYIRLVIKLVKMWLGGAPHVVVRTLKICLDRRDCLISPTLNSPTKNKFVSFRLQLKKILTNYRKV